MAYSKLCTESRILNRRFGMPDTKKAIAMDPQQSTVRPHQPGQDVFRSVLPEDINWKPFAAFPPAVRLAVVVGQPSEAGPYTIRVRVPFGVKLMPHRHPEDRVYTVISGVFYIGLGDRFDPDKLEAYPPGSVVVLPGDTSHFHWAKSGEYVTQVTAIGPLGLEYLSAKDDPRNKSSVEEVKPFGDGASGGREKSG
jgi:quercetin dioxygenase-like cupin family protein